MPIDNLSKITSRSGINTTILLEAGNANVTGIVTAAGFVGPFTGGGDVAAGIITGTGLKISGISTFTGAVFINRTSALGAAKLSITKDADQEGIGVQLNVSSGITTSLIAYNSSGSQIFDLAHDTDSTPDLLLKLKDSGDGFPVERVRITSNGNVGIGTHTPFTGGAHSGNHQLTITNNAPSMSLGLSNIDQLYVRREQANGKYTFQTNQSGGNNGVISLEPYGGFVGIGSLAPGAALEVNGRTSYDVAIFNTEHADGPLIPIQKAGSNIGFLGSGKNCAPATGGATDLALRSQNELIFTSGGGVERLRIDSNGVVRIQKTTTNAKIILSRNESVDTTNTVTGVIDFCNNTAHTTNSRIQGVTDGTGNVGGEILVETRDPGNSTLTEKFRIKGNGSVGIGTTNPNMALHVKSTSDDVVRFQSTSAGNGPAITLDHIGGSAADDDTIGKIVFNGQDDGNNSTTYADIKCITSDVSNGTETAHLDFGTRALNAFNPILRLSARSTASAPSYTTDDMNGIILDTYNTGGGSGYARYFSFIAKSAGDTNSDMLFWTESSGGSPTEKLRISSSGHVGINYGVNPNRYLQVRTIDGAAHNGVFAGENVNASNAATMFFLSTFRDSSSTEKFMQFNRDQDNNNQGVAAVFDVLTNGNVRNSNNSYSSISDVKLKENIIDASSQWNDIKNVRVRKFNFKSTPSETLIGVVAQEIETVSPGLVDDIPDMDLTKQGHEGTSTKSVKYSVLYMKAIKCLQEAQARIETLEAKVAALEGS